MSDEASDERLERVEKALEGPMLALTLVFVAAVLAPMWPEVSAATRADAHGVEMAVWILFAAEYAFLLALARDKGRFLRTHVLDLLMVALPAIRVVRIFRVLRLLRLAAATSAVGRALGGVKRVFGKYRLGYISLVFLTLLLGVSGLMLAIEGPVNDNLDTYPECLWWGITTMSNANSGDASPMTWTGRVLAAVVMLVGVALFGVVTATIASVFVGIERRDQEAEMRASVEALSAEVKGLREELRGEGEGANGGEALAPPKGN